ncbi:MAG: heparinase II/III family protein [Candidatus Diapherotrites archaeon]|nr:heparinase II/III family protein [Candidatus Diapherotrites archaeon]
MKINFILAIILVLFIVAPAHAKDTSCLMIDICGNSLDDDCENGADDGSCISVNQEAPEIAFSEKIDDLAFFSNTLAQDSMDSHNTGITGGHQFSGGWGYPGQLFIEGGTVEWDFTAPRTGHYILSFAGFSDSTHVGVPSYKNTGDWITLSAMNEDRGPQIVPGTGGWVNLWKQNIGFYHYLIYLDAGTHRFRVANTSNHSYHMWKSWISPVRHYPFTREPSSETHPKLFYSSSDLARINDNKTNSEPSWPLPDQYNSVCGSASKVCDSHLFFTRHFMNHTILKGIFENKQNYIDCGVNALMYFANHHYECGELPEQRLDTDWGNYLTQLSIWYDWLYPYLNDSQREEIRLILDARGHEMFMVSLGDSVWSRYDWLSLFQESLGNAGLANYGDHTYAEYWTAESFRQIDKFYVEKNFADGFPPRPIGHYGEGVTDDVLRFLGNYKRVNGSMEAKYEKIMDEAIIAHIYMLEPDREHFALYGSWGCDNDICRSGMVDRAFPAMVATVNRNTLAQWYHINTLGKNATRNYFEGTKYAFLLYDDSLQPASPNATLPKSEAFYKRGMAIMRSGFEDFDDVQLVMKAGIVGSGGKSDADQGSIFLNAYERHFVNEQTYTNSGSCPQSGDLTTNHNTVVIDNQIQVFCGKDGQDRLAQIDDFIRSDYLDYVSADLSNAWGSAEKARRSILYIRPNFFVILDDYKKDSSSHDYDWILWPSKNQFSIQDSGNATYRFEGGNEDLHIILAEPSGIQKQSGGSLRLRKTGAEAQFFALLYPTSSGDGVSLPTVTKFNETSVSGFSVGDDKIIRNKTSASVTSQGITTDAKIAVANPNNGLMAMIGGKQILFGSLQINSTLNTNVVLKKTGENYNIAIGNDYPDAAGGTTTFTITGVSDGDYSYTKDGIAQTGVVATGGILSIPVQLSMHTLVLQYEGATTCNGGAPDGTCEAGENCAPDNVGCPDNPCYEPTCSNGCGENPVPNGGNDESCAAPKQCDGSGNCIQGMDCVDMIALMSYIAQWKSGNLEMAALMQKVLAWKTQAGC